jgi:transcriptional regulator with XRE-family HTH domain
MRMTKATPCLPALLALSASRRDARTAADFGLRRLATKLGVPAQNLSLWETGKRAPTIADLAHVLGFLRVSPEEYSRVMQLRRQLDDPISLETLDANSASHRRALEELAIRTFEWAPHAVPEPLQTHFVESIHHVLRRVRPPQGQQHSFGQFLWTLPEHVSHPFFERSEEVLGDTLQQDAVNRMTGHPQRVS